MENKQLTSRQFGRIITLIIISNKFLLLPSLLFKDIGLESWLSCAFLILLDIVVGLVFYFASKRFQNETLYQLLCNHIGVFFTDLIFSIFFIFYLFQVYMFCRETKLYLTNTIYEEFSWQAFIIPLILVSCYISFNSLRTLGRTVEICYKFCIVGILLTYIIAISKLPNSLYFISFNTPLNVFFNSSLKNIGWFCNYTLLFFLIGTIKITPDYTKQVAKSSLVGIIIIIFFIWLYSNAFYVTGAIHKNAIANLTEFNGGLSSINKIDWFVTIVWLTTIFNDISIIIYIMGHIFRKVTRIKNRQVSSSLLFLIIIIFMFVIPFNFEECVNIYQNYLSYFAIFILSLISLLVFTILLLDILSKRSKIYDKALKE
jgi:hypothetical protein